MTKQFTTKDMALVSLFTALTVIGAFVSIPLGPVPITLQSLFVILSGIILGPRLGALSQISYVIIGLIGLPVFAGFTGGLQTIFSPSFGFIFGFIFASYIAGKVYNGFQNNSMVNLLTSSFIGTMVVYIFGLPYMYYILNIVTNSNLSLNSILTMGFLLFLPGDILKTIIAAFVAKRVLYLVK